MESKKALFFEVAAQEAETLREAIAADANLKGLQCEFLEQKLDASGLTLASQADIVSVFINSVLDKGSIDKLAKTRLIATRSTGFDHIDLEAAKSKPVSVANVPAYGSHTVAEFAFALILGLSRKVFEASYKVKSGQGFSAAGMMGFDLYGKTIGIVGTGRIGQNVAVIAKGFGMKVIAYDPYPNNEAAKNIGFDYVSLDDLLSRSDIVTLHAPYNPGTKHLINMENINRFKRGSLLVNTARGELCDNEALLTGLDKGILGGVGLDVVEGERKLKDGEKVSTFEKLRAHPHAFVTPHMAYFTAEAQKEIARVTVENISAFLRGEAKNVVS